MTNGDQADVRLDVVRLGAGDEVVVGAADAEHVVVVLGGSCTADFAPTGPVWTGLGARADVFDGRASAVYVPAGRDCRIVVDDSAHLAVIAAPATTSREPYVVRPEDVVVQHRGREAWQREVHDIVGVDQPADRLMVGETFSADGVWSSYPPHKHDRHDPPHESKMAEAFLVRVEPASGFGIFLHYPTEADERQVRMVADGDVVGVPQGFHSFVAAAGHRFYYLWALSGTERALCFRTDERHTWLLDEPEAEQ